MNFQIVRRLLLVAPLSMLGLAAAARADVPAFDLAGPRLSVDVTRDSVTLPIAEVPNLAVGDQINLQADFPPQQSAHYLMVAAFLRGATNPPPEDWFYREETWKHKNGTLTLMVPEGAQQMLIFLAPETGGDFRTLVNAVRGKPGAFVRASQDLNQAALDRSRLEVFLAGIKHAQATNPDSLKQDATLLGRSLGIKVDDKCFDRATEEQAPCLMHDQDAIILSDGHSQSIVQALTSGAAGDLATQLSLTPQANFGYYSPYVQSVMDIARILDALHTAQYQYIPALASYQGDAMALRLNVPPSFHNPKSVLVAALPAVEPPEPPPLRAIDPKADYCAEKSQLAVAVQGAPLIFSTAYAHDLQLRISQDGKTLLVPVKPDAEKGGLLVAANDLAKAGVRGTVQATLQGQWGFEPYTGPSFELVADDAPHWQFPAAERQQIVAGRENLVHLTAGDASCVEEVTLSDKQPFEPPVAVKPKFKALGAHELEVSLPLQQVQPRELQLNVRQFGGAVQAIPLRVFSNQGHVTRVNVHAGDSQAELHGSQLDQVASVTVAGVEFLPVESASKPTQELAISAQSTIVLKLGAPVGVDVMFKDGRVEHLDTTVGPPRPEAELVSKSIEGNPEPAIHLANADDLPQGATLVFSVRLIKSSNAGEAKVQVATQDESAIADLTESNGGLAAGSRAVLVGRLTPAKQLGAAKFGALKFRVLEGDSAGDWVPLATLVRLPRLSGIQCPADLAQQCTLTGSNLFLLESVGAEASYVESVNVPEGFTGSSLKVPYPTENGMVVKLRDDPSQPNPVTLPVNTPSGVKPAPQP